MTNNVNIKETNESPSNVKDDGAKVEQTNVIKALSSQKFQGDELKTYRDEIKPKTKGMLQISGFNTNSIQLDEIKIIC